MTIHFFNQGIGTKELRAMNEKRVEQTKFEGRQLMWGVIGNLYRLPVTVKGQFVDLE